MLKEVIKTMDNLRGYWLIDNECVVRIYTPHAEKRIIDFLSEIFEGSVSYYSHTWFKEEYVLITFTVNGETQDIIFTPITII